MSEDTAVTQVDQTITIQAILIGLCPRLKGHITDVKLSPKCKHDYEAHRVHSEQVRYVFGRIDAKTLRAAADAGRIIRDGQTQAVIIRQIGGVS